MPPLPEPGVVLEDATFVVLDKPAGWIVIPGRGEPETPLRSFAEGRFGAIWVVHRLDRGTSGLIVFARSAEAHRTLNGAFEQHRVAKRYLAVVAGQPPERLRIDVPLVPARRGKMRPARPGERGAKAAVTLLRRVQMLGPYALVELEPESGRTHQIRVHLRSAGFPLALDPDYGSSAPLLGEGGSVLIARTPLHAAFLRFPHPVTGEAVAVESPTPPDMARLIAAFA